MRISLLNPGVEDNNKTLSSNLGDLIIEESVRQELWSIDPKAKIYSISTQVHPGIKQLRRIMRSNLQFVGGTNLLSSNMDSYSQWKIEPMHTFAIREAILMGVGWWQYQKETNKYTAKLLRKALSSKWLHSVRDSYTVEKLRQIGITNVINTGCPTMWPLADFRPEDYPTKKSQSVLLMLTDYISLHHRPELDGKLIELLLSRYQTVYYWPQGRQDLELIEMWRGRLVVLDHDISALYSLLESEEPLDYVGTRLHGGVACLRNKRRSLILKVDNRAAEISRDTNLTTCSRDDFDFIAKWIDSSTQTDIRINMDSVNAWRSQFTEKNIRKGKLISLSGRVRGSNEVSVDKIKGEVGKSLMVNLGCGSRFSSKWVNLDFNQMDPSVIVFDLRNPLPIASNQCDVVYSSHVIEHFSKIAGVNFIKECHRVLKSGAILRLVVPDLEMIARLYLRYLDKALAGDCNGAIRHEWMTLELLDQLVRDKTGGEIMRYWQQNPMPDEDFVIERTGAEVRTFLDTYRKSEHSSFQLAVADSTPQEFVRFLNTGESHRWMYDQVSLKRLLEELGFSSVRKCAAAESLIPGFNAFNLDTDAKGNICKPDSLYIEGTKS